MRYAIFTDIHANLEALGAVLDKIDELAQEDPIDQIWFLGDLVGYGPNPNECITKLRERTDVIIAGNHDWAAVGKIDLEDFSEAARISAEWTAVQLTEEHRQFLINLPERLQIGECTLVHGSPYGPLWEYLTSSVLAERSFQYFYTRYCLVGHTHVPIIFQQPDTISNIPTTPLGNSEQNHVETESTASVDEEKPGDSIDEEEEETVEIVAILPALHTMQATTRGPQAVVESPVASSNEDVDEEEEIQSTDTSDADVPIEEAEESEDDEHLQQADTEEDEQDDSVSSPESSTETTLEEDSEDNGEGIDEDEEDSDEEEVNVITPEEVILSAEERNDQEIEELLALLGLSQSMIQVTNEMVLPPEGDWQAPEEYRAIINPGGVGQPRDGDPRAAFMIYDTERGFTFYRVPYAIEKTQEKIIKAGLPTYLAARLSHGR